MCWDEEQSRRLCLHGSKSHWLLFGMKIQSEIVSLQHKLERVTNVLQWESVLNILFHSSNKSHFRRERKNTLASSDLK